MESKGEREAACTFVSYTTNLRCHGFLMFCVGAWVVDGVSATAANISFYHYYCSDVMCFSQ